MSHFLTNNIGKGKLNGLYPVFTCVAFLKKELSCTSSGNTKWTTSVKEIWQYISKCWKCLPFGPVSIGQLPWGVPQGKFIIQIFYNL